MKIKRSLALAVITISFFTHLEGYTTNKQVDTLYQQIRNFYKSGDYDSAITLGSQLRQLAADKGIDSIQFRAISIIAKSYNKKRENEKSLHTLYDLLETSEKLNNHEGQALAYFDLGRKFASAYDYDIALQHMKKAKLHYELAGNSKEQSKAAYHIARMLLKKVEKAPNPLTLADSAILVLDEALNVISKKYPSITSSINNLLGIIEFERENYVEARRYYQASLRYIEVDSFKYAISYHNIGETYLHEGNLDLAKVWLEKALDIKRSIKKSTSVLLTLSLMARVYEQEGDVPKALDLLNQGLALVDMGTAHENTVMALSLVTEIAARHPENGLSNSKLTSYLAAYHMQNEALITLKTQLQEFSSRQEIKAMHKTYEIKKQAGVERQETIYRITTIAVLVGLATLATLVTPLFLKNKNLSLKHKRLVKDYEKERKIVVHTAERVYELLSINKSLRKSYNEIYRTFKGGDYLKPG